jgi:hypothetical protein
MISILDDVSVVTSTRAELIVQGANISELMHADTSSLVLKKAAELGLNRPGVSNASGPYPVDDAGRTDNELLLGRRGPVAGYRRDFVVLASI